jgi:hypothetical protein
MGVQVTRMVNRKPTEALMGGASVDTLRFAERMVVWTARVWWATARADGGHRAFLAEAHDKLGVASAVAAIDKTLLLYRIGAIRRVLFGHPEDRGLGDDEKRLLHALACAQRGTWTAARPVLDAVLAPATTRVAEEPLTLWAGLLSDAGLDLPFRDWDVPELRAAPGFIATGRRETRVVH